MIRICFKFSKPLAPGTCLISVRFQEGMVLIMIEVIMKIIIEIIDLFSGFIDGNKNKVRKP